MSADEAAGSWADRLGLRGPDRPATLGAALLVLAVATSSWNAVAIGPLKVTHAALALACLSLGFSAWRRRSVVWVPAWVWVLAAAITVVVVATLLWPPVPEYFAARYAEDVPDALEPLDTLGRTSAVAGVQWLVAALGLPLTVCLAAPGRIRLLALLADAWALGAAVSGAVAFLDLARVTRISEALLGPVYWGGREAGLAVHPNHLSLSIVMALPIVVWRLARAARPLGLLRPVVAAVPMLAGLVAGGSRAGLAGGALVVLAGLVVEPRTRRLLPWLAGAAVVLALGVVVAVPGTLESLGGWFRLDGSGGSDASDRIRSGLAAQAWADFLHSPVHGIGFEVLVQGHNIALQTLAAGGVILLLGFALAQFGFLLDGWSVPDGGSGLARALVVCGGAFVVVGMVGNQIADVFVTVPFALVAGLCAAATLRSDPAGSVGGEPLMTFESAMAQLRARWRVLVVGALVGLVVAGGAAATMPARQSAEAGVYVSGLDAVPSPGADPVTNILLIEQRITSYRSLMVSERVLGPVAQEVGTPLPSGTVAVTEGKASSVFGVVALDRDPGRARQIASAVADRFVEVLREVEPPGRPGGAAVTGTVVERPVATTPTAPGVASTLLAGLVAGAIAGAAWVLVQAARDARRRRAEAPSGVDPVETAEVAESDAVAGRPT